MLESRWPIDSQFNTVVAVNNSRAPFGPEPMPAAPVLTPAQRTVLDELRSAVGPARVGDVASALGLHANTVREHLDALVDAGLALRRRADSAGRGRPAWLYSAAATPEESMLRAYTGMAVALAGQLRASSDDPAAQARDLGRSWGRELARSASSDAADVRERVIAQLSDFGFAPVDGADDIELTRCPLLDAARRYPDVTCQIHLGLVQGTLDDAGDMRTRPVLRPFARRGACALRLEPVSVRAQEE